MWGRYGKGETCRVQNYWAGWKNGPGKGSLGLENLRERRKGQQGFRGRCKNFQLVM